VISNKSLKERATALRKAGKTYSEILGALGVTIPKSTLSYWFKDLSLSVTAKHLLKRKVDLLLNKARKKAIKINKQNRKVYLSEILKRNMRLDKFLLNKNIAKIILATLYIGEGAKQYKRGSLMFGNSDPEVISFFLRLLRYCYNIDENKFRCTVQCRYGQDIKNLERFWSKVTGIPFNQFYKSRIDPRTKDRVIKKPLYKGVCRIDYFSSEIFIELMIVAKIVYKGARSLEEKR